MNKYKLLAAASLALVLLAACGTTSDIFGGGGNNTGNQRYDIRGTVESVDLSSHSIYLTNVSGNTSMLSGSGGGNNIRVYYSTQTPVDYQGRSYRPEDLERGDQVSVRVDDSGNRLQAQSMTVLYNASNTGNTYPSGNYPAGGYPSGTSGTTLHGTVRNVDTRNGRLEIDRGYGSTVYVDYSTSTPVYFNNQTYRPTDLQRGDQIDIRATDLGNGRFSAQDITVTRSMSGNGTYGNGSASTSTSTVRGTVRYVDASNRTIQIDSPSWISGFVGGGSGTSTLTVRYDSNTMVDVQGRSYPVTNLERGDVIEIQAQNAGGSNLLANRILLVRDVNQR